MSVWTQCSPFFVVYEAFLWKLALCVLKHKELFANPDPVHLLLFVYSHCTAVVTNDRTELFQRS